MTGIFWRASSSFSIRFAAARQDETDSTRRPGAGRLDVDARRASHDERLLPRARAERFEVRRPMQSPAPLRKRASGRVDARVIEGFAGFISVPPRVPATVCAVDSSIKACCAA